MKFSVKTGVFLAFFLFFGAFLAAQANRDFLSEDEADQIREAQEPAARVTLYLKFARLRLELVKQTLAVEKAGRSRVIHNNLEDYSRIIGALDAAIDDALSRKLDLQKGVALVAQREKEFLALLEDFSNKPAKDRYLFEFALKDALETTQDSLEDSQQDAQIRTQRVADEDARDKKKTEAMMSTQQVEERRAEEKKAGPARKAPTLRRKDEAPKDSR